MQFIAASDAVIANEDLGDRALAGGLHQPALKFWTIAYLSRLFQILVYIA